MDKPLLTAILFCCAVSPCLSQNGNHFFRNDFIHEIRMYSDDPNLWEYLLTNHTESQGPAENIYEPVDVVIDGTSLSSVGLRIKGFSSSWEPRKKPFRLDFNEYVAGQSYDGLKKISLNNAYLDASVMRDVIAYDIFRYEGLAASRTSYAKVYINDEYFGVYIAAEQIDKTFLKSRFGDDDGNLYKCIGWSELKYEGDDKDVYKTNIELKTNEAEDDWSRFIEFVKFLNKYDISDEEYQTEFPKKFDVEGYLKVLAIDILLQNWDSYYAHGRNFYIYDNPETEKMTWIPWDYSFSFSATSVDILASNNPNVRKPLIRNLLGDPAMVNRLAKAYQEILDDNFTVARLAPLIDQYKALILEELKHDPHYHFTSDQFAASLEETVSVHREDTVTLLFDLEQFHIVSDWSHYPTGEPYHGKILIDTTWYFYNRIEVLDFGNGPKEFLYAKQARSWDETVIGLKGFIRDRIVKVRDELAKLGSVTTTEGDDTTTAFNISPNPAMDRISISGALTDRPFDVMLFDATGKPISVVRQGKELNVQDLPAGDSICFASIHYRVALQGNF